MLMLQIAGGVVLGFIALALLPQLLRAAALVAGLALLAYLVAFGSTHWPNATTWATIAGIAGALVIGIRNKIRNNERIKEKQLTWIAEQDAPTPESIAARREAIKTYTKNRALAVAGIAADLSRPRLQVDESARKHYWTALHLDPQTFQRV
jgi:hypothetical protein